jgi:hypothetical protein
MRVLAGIVAFTFGILMTPIIATLITINVLLYKNEEINL